MKKLVMLSKERFLTDVSTICRLGFRCPTEVLRFLPLRRLIFCSPLPDFSPAGEWSPGMTSSPPSCAVCLGLALPLKQCLIQPQPEDSGQELVAGNLCFQTHTLQCSSFSNPTPYLQNRCYREALVTVKASQPWKVKAMWNSINWLNLS